MSPTFADSQFDSIDVTEPAVAKAGGVFSSYITYKVTGVLASGIQYEGIWSVFATFAPTSVLVW
jgi:hypothetical protein